MQYWYLMEVLADARSLGLDIVPARAQPVSLLLGGLAINPVKLLLLIGWVYLGLFCVQKIEFSPAVPRDRKPLMNLLTLVFGPIPLMWALMADVLRTPAAERGGLFHAMKDRFLAISDRIKSFDIMGGGKKDGEIKLLDSSGRDLKELYGHGKIRKQDSHILEYTEEMIWDALQDRASDILIDPKSDSLYTIRFRVDGVLREIDRIDANTCGAVINSIKAISNMDISERRRPQDGAFIAKTAEGTVSFRVASAGVLNGEKLSIRVLKQDASVYTLESIGLSEKQRNIIEAAVSKPSGMVLMCGPTGSGKTTTMYGILNKIDFYTRNVITVEDPIEYVLPNTSQIEVNTKAGITFAKSLRSILRQDPDVICVGEIRDEETAVIALQAAQTGHLVLATVHSNSTSSALIRLLDLNVTPLMLATGLSLVISQRLLRRLCKYCRAPAKLSSNQIREFEKKKINYANIYQAVGCDNCYGTGYYGRIGIYDILALDDDLRNSITSGKLPVTDLRKEGDTRGKSNLQKQGLLKVVTGITSLDELARVVG
ncbi:MAG: type II/IV secretion system protein [Sedimentisphaerales bacterium]|nr:type II/IV secretion system protein [Sedimentisphaerales bacterium]